MNGIVRVALPEFKSYGLPSAACNAKSFTGRVQKAPEGWRTPGRFAGGAQSSRFAQLYERGAPTAELRVIQRE